jgi:hypothetical protein
VLAQLQLEGLVDAAAPYRDHREADAEQARSLRGSPRAGA